MSNQANKVEIMAPVGSFEALTAAIKANCDSVYFGVEQLNMRARSSKNFTTDDLKEICNQAKKNKVNTYLTMNTILYDHDIRLMRTIVDKAKENGVTSIIASDHAVMGYCKSINMPVHISTQANITNIETIEFYAAFADVMVLSRELSLRQVEHITKEIKRKKIIGPSGNLIGVEVFVHGALCMAVSGKCYLSLHSNNASANRGACIQNCRHTYVVTDKEDGNELEIDNEYIMSAKDLCTIGFLDKVIEAGLGILKIEGRGRSADYVDTTVRCYREAADAVLDGSFNADKIEDWTSRLATVFNRGFWDGYYLGRTLGEWNNSYGSKATEQKILTGKGVKYFKNRKIAEFKLDAQSLQKGDQILISGPTTGVIKTTVSEIWVNDKPVDYAEKGTNCSIPISEIIRSSDKLYKVLKTNV